MAYPDGMPYPGQFHKLVIMGTIYEDVFNTTLSIVPSALGELGMPEVDSATLAAVAANVSDWWDNGLAGTGIVPITSCKLTGIKLNRIGTDGHYVDSPTMEHTYPTPILGLNSAVYPAQNATVATLRTAVPRGRGSKGRMYLPPNISMQAIDGTGKIPAATALSTANGVKWLITALNSTYTLIGRVGVASNAGAGRFEHVTEVSVGRIIDTVRSRRSALSEDYQTVAV